MVCAFPRKGFPRDFPCGRCMPCRVHQQRKKLTRLLLEAMAHDCATFITLTYNDYHLPRKDINDWVLPVLYPRDLTLFLKRLRTRRGKFRYFACGEYGTKTWRPHYHAILFGIPQTELEHEDLLLKTWGMGHVSHAEGTVDRYKYVAHYTIKKMTQETDRKLDGRPPEFMRCSRRPGLGYMAARRLAEYYETRGGAEYLATHGDIAHTVRYDGKEYPLDEYMLAKMRGWLGIPPLAADRELVLIENPDAEYGEALEDTEIELLRDKAEKYHHKKSTQAQNHGTL